MNNIQKYKTAFSESFSIDLDKVSETLEYNEIEEWDSIGHMTLIAALEEKFDISFETDDIVDFSSFEKGKEILGKYKINF
jgi:acyl carrier protein